MDRKEHKRFSNRMTEREKRSGDYQWYKDKAREYLTIARSKNMEYYYKNGEVDEKRKMKTNFDLFNNIINLEDFEYVCKPFGDIEGTESSELPAEMVNRDISSYRIKALLGMEMNMPFGYKLMAINPEATTRKEEEKYERVKNYVIDRIMAPIRRKKELEYLEKMKGKELDEEEVRELNNKIETEVEKNKPERINRYMERKYQSPSEVQGNQLLEYLKKKLNVKKKIQKGWKSATLSAYEVYYVGEKNNRPTVKTINPLEFTPIMGEDDIFIEDGRAGVYETKTPITELVEKYDLKDAEIDRLYELQRNDNGIHVSEPGQEDNWFGNDFYDTDDYEHETVVEQHVCFKALRKVGFLDYINAGGELVQRELVDEKYKFDEENGDINIDWEWVEATYEVSILGGEIYKNMGLVKGQMKDESEVYSSKLCYIGAVYDNDNSVPTSIMDRMKYYQYLYNIIMYRVELLISSDEGKKILMNINAIPDEAGVDTKQWRYFFKSSPISYFNPNQEGMRHEDANTIARELDLSLVSDIGKYIDILGYLEEKCGKAVGITDPVLGETAVSEKVQNNQQNLTQKKHMLEPYFDLHDHVKKNVLQSLLNKAREIYTREEAPEHLSYTSDDMSGIMFKIDKDLLSTDTLGLFIEDSSKAEAAKEAVNQLAHAAMQNDKAELSDMLSIIKKESPQEAEETLRASEKERKEEIAEESRKEREHKERLQKIIEENKEKAHEREKEIIKLKEEEERKTDIAKQLVLSAGFNEDKDVDNDGVPDILEYAKNSVDAKIKMKEQERKDKEFEHNKRKDNKELEIKEKEANNKDKKE